MAKKLKNVFFMGFSLVLVAVLAIGGTIAYLADTDSDVNVMTMGNVSIDQLEYERIPDAATTTGWKAADTEYAVKFGNDTYYPDAMQKFTQNKPALPAVYQDSTIKWDDRNGSQAASGTGSHQQSWAEVGAPGSNQLFDDSVKNVIDKFVFVKNTGRTDSYYRTFIAIECPKDLDESLIHLNTNGNFRFDWEDLGTTTIGDVQYLIKVATYNQILTPDEISRPSLLQIFLDPAATNEDCALFGDTWEILVVSQAVQADGFTSADSALTEAFGDTEDGYHPWANPVSSADDLVKAIEAGETTVLLDKDITLTETLTVKGELTIIGNGKTLTAPANGTRVVNANDNEGDVEINLVGVTLDGSDIERGISFYNNAGALDVNITDSVIKANHYGINVASNNADATLSVSNSEISGFCAFQTWSAGTDVTFDNCVLSGTNRWNAASGSFGTIVINEGATDCTLIFNNCTLVAKETDTAKQYHVLDKAGDAVCEFNNCTFTYEGSSDVEDGQTYVMGSFQGAIDGNYGSNVAFEQYTN